MTQDMTDKITREISSVFSSAFDPDPIVFKEADEVGVRPVRNACKKPNGMRHTLKKPLNRNAFLCGCLDFTEEEPIEHLIVGLGLKHGSSTKVCGILHSTGSEAAVSVPPEIQSVIETHLNSEHRTEVLVFHNHPANPVNTLIDNSPIASDADRRIWASLFLKPSALIKALMGGGAIRFHIGENRFVAEFRTPQLLDVIKHAAKH